MIASAARPSRLSLRAVATALATILVAAAAMAGTLALLGADPAIALGALWEGAFGSTYAVTSATLLRAVPLALAGLAVAVAFRARVFNVGAEGQLLVGATAAAATAALLGDLPRAVALPLVLLAGASAGAAWAGIAALLRHRFAVLEVISTILLNFVALHLVGFLVRGPMQEPTGIYPQSPPIPNAAHLPMLLPGTRLHVGAVLAVALAALLWWALRATATGFRLRAAGANPSAARSAGEIDVARVTAGAFLASGALAGLAGAVELTGVTYALYENLSPGYGFTAIAVALLARLNPLGVLLAAALFGALEAGAAAMQRDAGVPSALVTMLTALAILGVVAAARRKA